MKLLTTWWRVCCWCAIGSMCTLANFVFGLVLGYYIHENKKEDN